ncbi:flagellar protein FlaG [Alkalicoccus urumqiensis]|uniref:Flagellar biosynthesis protein FlaG n=1 Tax=Alkalicoccus urumqiensis TaxID=1548213 RepID=A0A2P6MH67_ALKUR|nr:flagellar protein FlaG [Alkalicoccus urumqiensis]PRO65629.1 flagellar biosynthesis protein FlaG [Alkalicoccus urumqiensis]
MEVKSTGSMSVHDLFDQVQSERGSTRPHQADPANGSAGPGLETASAQSMDKPAEWTQSELDKGLAAMNELSMFKKHSLSFEQHEKLDRTMVKVVDQETDEIVREIPPEKFLDMISSMLEFAGILIDEKI